MVMLILHLSIEIGREGAPLQNFNPRLLQNFVVSVEFDAEVSVRFLQDLLHAKVSAGFTHVTWRKQRPSWLIKRQETMAIRSYVRLNPRKTTKENKQC